MTPRHVALWHLRQEKIQRARAVLKQSNGDLGAAQQAEDNARMHQLAASLFACESLDLTTYEHELHKLQLEFRTWLFDRVQGRQITDCTMNGLHYDSLHKLLSYSHAMAVAHPGVESIEVVIGFADYTETHAVPKEFTQKRMQVLRGA